MVKSYGPKDKWPDHQRSYVSDLLSHARSLGWSFVRHSEDPWGKLWCPAHDCNLSVGSTPDGQEGWCKGARRYIDQCVHNEFGPILDKLEAHLVGAETFMQAAEFMAERQNCNDRLNVLLQEVEGESDAAERLFERALALESEEEETLAPVPDALVNEGPRETMLEAEREARRAEKTKKRLPRAHEAVRGAEMRIADVRERVKRLRPLLRAKH